MSENKLHLMSFMPEPGVMTVVHVVGLPEDLKAALFELMPPRKEGGCLGTRSLRDDLRCWLDRAVELNPVYPGGDTRDWLIALEPVCLDRLCSVISAWVYASCDVEARSSPAYRKVIGLLRPGTFEGFARREEICLFDDSCRPASALAFPAFSAQVANALVGQELVLANGKVERFSRISQGTSSAYDLMSEVHWHKEYPWAFVLRFHVETVPDGRKARLNMDVVVRRFIHATWQDDLYIKNNVGAYVRTDNGTYRVVPYGYVGDRGRADAGRFDWDDKARRNYELLGRGALPSIQDYLTDMGRYACDGAVPQILSPYAVSASWASKHGVATGASVVDKAMFFEAAAKRLEGVVRPADPLESAQLVHLRTAYEEPRRREGLDGAEANKQELWARSNRSRLAKCTGRNRVVFQLVGETADAHILDMVRSEIICFLGGEGCIDGFEVMIENLCPGTLLNPLENESDAAAMVRWRAVENALGQASELTACVVVLPGADHFKRRKAEPKENGGKSKSRVGDPKEALRIGFAKTGRLTQFLRPEEPEDPNDNPEIRACVAVRDLMRQLGFVPELADGRRGVDTSLPVMGLRVYGSGNDKKPASFPYCVRQDTKSGLVSVDCPLFADGSLPYWQALLEFARLSGAKGFSDSCKSTNGAALKYMVDGMVRSASEPALLLVKSYGLIRRRDWWPGISDSGLESGILSYGPLGDEEPLDLSQSRLRILRVRSGANGEVPDWFTDEAVSDELAESVVPNRRDKQGIFQMDGYALALASRPGDAQYKWSPRSSKYDAPGEQFCEKTINEYCLLSEGDDREELGLVRFAEALRECMVQLYKSDMKVNMPAPLHLAEQMEEYIWEWDKPKRGRRG